MSIKSPTASKPGLHRGLLRDPEANKEIFEALHGHDYTDQWKKKNRTSPIGGNVVGASGTRTS